MTPEHIATIRDFYMRLLELNNLKDSIFHQAHCEEMVALCNFALAAQPEAALKALHEDLGTLKWIGSDQGWDLAIKAVRAEIEQRCKPKESE